MTHLESLPARATLLDLLRAYPEPVAPLLEMHERVLRGPSSLTPGERELIAAYVSGLNGCGYCRDIHTVTAEAFGVPEGLLADLLVDIDGADVNDQMKPLLHYVSTLTRSPAALRPSDAEAVRAAGWDDRALYDAILVCGLFNLMNRIVDGVGISPEVAYPPTSGRALHEGGYAGLAELVGADTGGDAEELPAG